MSAGRIPLRSNTCRLASSAVHPSVCLGNTHNVRLSDPYVMMMPSSPPDIWSNVASPRLAWQRDTSHTSESSMEWGGRRAADFVAALLSGPVVDRCLASNVPPFVHL